jgi:UDP-2,3-diacylglucosamine hydrolase
MAEGTASQRIPGRSSPAVGGGRSTDDRARLLPVLYIAGDIHLPGTPEDARSAFVRFLDRLAARPPARLVLLGDLFEYWLETGAAAARYEPVLSRLRALADAGWRLDLVRGNRELAGGRMLEVSTGCRLHWPRLDLALGNRRVRVVHGDRLCHDPGYRFFSAWIVSFWHRVWQIVHPAPLQDAVARALRRGSRSHQLERQAARPPRARQRVFIDRRRVQASGRGVDTVIAGHIHESWRRAIGGVDLILVGHWPGDVGHWIEGYADGRLERVTATF